MTAARPRTPGTILLMAAILGGFAIEILTGAWLNGAQLAELGAISRYYILIEGEYWRLLTSMFLHGDGTVGGDVLHLVFNLFALWQLGSLFEMLFGTRRFLFLYFTTGILASVASLWFSGGPSLGASGAIFGIIGALVVSIRRSRFRHEKWAKGIVQQLIFWIGANIVIGMSVPQIDNAAHIAGLVAGFLLGSALPHRAPPPPAPSDVVIDVRPHDDGAS